MEKRPVVRCQWLYTFPVLGSLYCSAGRLCVLSSISRWLGIASFFYFALFIFLKIRKEKNMSLNISIFWWSCLFFYFASGAFFLEKALVARWRPLRRSGCALFFPARELARSLSEFVSFSVTPSRDYLHFRTIPKDSLRGWDQLCWPRATYVIVVEHSRSPRATKSEFDSSRAFLVLKSYRKSSKCFIFKLQQDYFSNQLSNDRPRLYFFFVTINLLLISLVCARIELNQFYFVFFICLINFIFFKTFKN